MYIGRERQASSQIKSNQSVGSCRQQAQSILNPPPFPTYTPLQVIVNKHNNEAQMNRYWTDLMSGVQLDALPSKDISFVRDFLPLVQSITVKDLQVCMYVCMGAALRFCGLMNDLT